MGQPTRDGPAPYVSVERVGDELAPLDLLRAVLDPVRLAVLGAAARGEISIDQLADELETPRRNVARAIGDLRAHNILDKDGSLNRASFADLGRALPKEHTDLGEPVEGPWTEDEARTLGRFFADGRLVELPRSAAKRRLVLEKFAQEFEPGERYAERDLNFKIQLIYPDHAAIRRYMVEEGLMDRADGSYWRIGGRYEAPTDSGRAPLVIGTSIEGVDLVEYDTGRIQELVAAAGDERIHRYMSDLFPHPYTVDDAETWIDFCKGQEPPNNFMITIDGTLRGGVGASPMSGEKEGVAEIGWWLNPQWWGRGISTAAATALVDHLFAVRGLERLWAPVFAPNVASAGVALGAGMVLEGTAPCAYVKHGVRYDELDFGITREQWEALRSP